MMAVSVSTTSSAEITFLAHLQRKAEIRLGSSFYFRIFPCSLSVAQVGHDRTERVKLSANEPVHVA